MAAILSKILN